MRTGSLICIAAALAALSPVALAADEIAWGAPFDGMRLGITLDRSLPDPSFRVLLQNNTDAPRDVQVAVRTSAEDHFHIWLEVIEPEGTPRGLFDSRHPSGGITAKATPLIVRIESGKAYELLFPLDKLSYFEDGRRVPVQVLLDAGWAVHAYQAGGEVSGKIQTTK